MSIAHVLAQFATTVAAPPGIVNPNDLTDTNVQNIFNVVLALAGAVAVAFVVFGGIKYMLSQGEPNEIKQARDTILYSVIGLVIVVMAFMLVNYVLGQF